MKWGATCLFHLWLVTAVAIVQLSGCGGASSGQTSLQAPLITSAASATFTEGMPGNITVTATGSPTPTLSQSGTLPHGLSFDTATGLLSGIPEIGTNGSYLLSFTASNGVNPDATQSFTLTVNAASRAAPTITSANNATFTVGVSGRFTVTATGSPTPALGQTGTLPSGITFDVTSGLLSGTPASWSKGSYPLTFIASNGVDPDATQSFTLTVNDLGTTGVIAIPRTGQASCWEGGPVLCTGTGQDGNLQKGVAWPIPRFMDNGDQTITDRLTGLIWSRDANPAATMQSWQQALDYIKTLNAQNYLGHGDWRLPNIIELKSLYNAQQADSAAWLLTFGFSNASDLHWSSSTFAYRPNSAWATSGDAGGAPVKTGSVAAAWPVRAGGSGVVALPASGQSGCWDADGVPTTCPGTGQDGDLRQGVAWPESRFTDNSDQTMTDRLTGLVWTKDAKLTDILTWQQALDYIKTLNAQNYLGHNDWRLPNLFELGSLVNFQQANNSAWLAASGFSNVPPPYHCIFWSSTSVAELSGNSSFVYVVDLYSGETGVARYYRSYLLWPVRGGQ